MARERIISFIKKLKKPVFTTHELEAVSGKSLSAVVHSLNVLLREGVVLKIYRGIWAETAKESISPYSVVPYLFPRHRAYVSFISALHLHGIIEQIPQMVTLASTAHTKIIHTSVGVFSVHRIASAFFDGFSWYKKTGSFLIAEPEKALVDSLYLSARKKKQFGHFPEMHFSKSFSFKKARSWVKRIPDSRIRGYVRKKLAQLEG